MPTDPTARRGVAAADLARLSEWLDRFENADDPVSDEARGAEVKYHALVGELFRECVQPHYAAVTRAQFQRHVRARCKQIIAQQTRKPPVPPP
jgi:hypothetical protein